MTGEGQSSADLHREKLVKKTSVGQDLKGIFGCHRRNQSRNDDAHVTHRTSVSEIVLKATIRSNASRTAH